MVRGSNVNYGSFKAPESSSLERLVKSIVQPRCQRSPAEWGCFTRHFNPSRNPRTLFPPADPLLAPCFLSRSFPEALAPSPPAASSFLDVNRFLKTPHLANSRGCRQIGGFSFKVILPAGLPAPRDPCGMIPSCGAPWPLGMDFAGGWRKIEGTKSRGHPSHSHVPLG